MYECGGLSAETLTSELHEAQNPEAHGNNGCGGTTHDASARGSDEPTKHCSGVNAAAGSGAPDATHTSPATTGRSVGDTPPPTLTVDAGVGVAADAKAEADAIAVVVAVAALNAVAVSVAATEAVALAADEAEVDGDADGETALHGC